MSADSWAICPRCKKNAEQESDRREREVSASYGKVDSETYRMRFAEAAAFRETLGDLENTLREDYELGIDEDGTFTISYRAGCRKCGLVFEYLDEQKGIDK